MESKDLIKHLSSLVHTDIDAIHAYDQAIEKIDYKEVRDRLSDFRTDHHRHVTDLSSLIRDMGGDPPEFKRDFKGFLIEGFTALRSVTGTEASLKAMKTNERLTNATYEKALSWDVPTNVRDVIRKNREDERRHFDYIDQVLQSKPWEGVKAA
ncbi:MAG: hypothetical protein A2X94_00310 [Bdellovibrionales bacterium GWB1_55_8]|nr:MAG: hypothetical protein A2X94_00310 [Bdellovibrionales bacterium GWB1_55_8]